MSRGGLGHRDAIAGTGDFIKPLRLGERFASPLDGEEIQLRRGHQGGSGHTEGEEPRVVDPLTDKAEDVLLGVGGRVRLSPVAHPAPECRDVAANRGNRHARVEGGNVGGQGAAARVAHATDAGWIDLGQGREVIDAAHPVPDPVARQAGAEEIERIAEHGVLAAGQVEPRAASCGIPELAPLPLTDWVVRQDDIAPPRQVDVQGLVRPRGLAVGRMAAGAEDARPRRRDRPGFVEQCRHEIAGEALIGQLFDDVVIGLDGPGLLHRWWSAGLLGEAIEQAEERLAERGLKRMQVVLRRDGRKPGAAPFFLAHGQVEELLVDVRCVRAGGNWCGRCQRQAGRRRQGQIEEVTSRNGGHSGLLLEEGIDRVDRFNLARHHNTSDRGKSAVLPGIFRGWWNLGEGPGKIKCGWPDGRPGRM